MNTHTPIVRKPVSCVVLGDQKTGKTCLIDSFLQRRFSLNYQETVSMQVRECRLHDPVQFQTCFVNFVEIGRKSQSVMFDSSIPVIVAALLVYDITDRSSFLNACAKWFDAADQIASVAIVMLVGTKCDIQKERAVTQDEAAEFASDHGVSFVETSSMDQTNIDLCLRLLRIRIQHHTPPDAYACDDQSDFQDAEVYQEPIHQSTLHQSTLHQPRSLPSMDDANPMQTENRGDSQESNAIMMDANAEKAFQEIVHTPVKTISALRGARAAQFADADDSMVSSQTVSGDIVSSARVLQKTRWNSIPNQKTINSFRMALKPYVEKNGKLIPVVEATFLGQKQVDAPQPNKGLSRSRSLSKPVASEKPRGSLQKHDSPKTRSTVTPTYITIDIGDGRSGQISYMPGDDAKVLAASFVKRNQLDASVIPQLASLITQQARALKQTESNHAKPIRPNTHTSKQSYSTAPTVFPTPLFTLDIDLGSGKCGTLTVYEDDDPSAIALGFVRQHGLNDIAAEQIASTIQQQQQLLMPRRDYIASADSSTTILDSSDANSKQEPATMRGHTIADSRSRLLFSIDVQTDTDVLALKVMEGRKPIELAREFVTRHKLQQDAIHPLAQLIHEKLVEFQGQYL
eukprot:TRINITY_DN4680_c0_g2_i2.p1 TRINITY_DN4680_c0_g2~~TRINITY_DN4680_c0_g2_i2.p1  ORF type:complete len:629 (+),score=141.72 TRINITY_DN4680_c0_g2_i2:64-1950(+)